PGRPAHTIAAKSVSAASAPKPPADGPVRPSDKAGQGAPPAEAGACPGEGRGHNLLHLSQKLIAPRLLLLARVFRLRKAALLQHRPVPHHPTANFTQPRRQVRLILASP